MTAVLMAGQVAVPVGDVIADFQAWRRPVDGPAGRYADHTCVSSTDAQGGTQIFECFSDDADLHRFTPVGGTAGPGDFTVADAHRCPPKDSAGIARYGIDGVCHQAANRFLSCVNRGGQGVPTLNPDDVAGYALSRAVYGVYGRDWQPWLGDDHLVELFLAEVRALGIALEPEVARGLHVALLGAKAALDESGMTGNAYVEQLDAITEDFQVGLASAMSEQDYRVLIGTARGEVLRLIPPDLVGLVGRPV